MVVGRAGVFAGAVAMLAAGLLAHRAQLASGSRPAAIVGVVTAALLGALLALAWTLTSIPEGAVTHHGDATWRLRIDPWDARAMLAQGWASQRRGELDRAHAQALEALRMGSPRGPALELEAEVLALRGECAAARDTFDEALRARATRAFDEAAVLEAPLSLGGYQIPPALVTECGGLERLPDLSDITRRARPPIPLSDP